MTELKSRIHGKSNSLDYVLVGDYYVPDLKLPEEHRPIGMWGRLHRTYLEQYRPARLAGLGFYVLSLLCLMSIFFFVKYFLIKKYKLKPNE